MDLIGGGGGGGVDADAVRALSLWPELKRQIPPLFDSVEVRPSLLHGDLWAGNVAQVDGKAGAC